MPETDWHLDKRVPVALILTLFVQAAAFGYFVAQLDGRITAAELSVTQLERRADVSAVAQQQQAVQLGRIEEQIGATRADLNRILNILERR